MLHENSFFKHVASLPTFAIQIRLNDVTDAVRLGTKRPNFWKTVVHQMQGVVTDSRSTGNEITECIKAIEISDSRSDRFCNRLPRIMI